MGDKELIKAILHYQQCLDKYTRRNDEARVLYCLSKLYKMPVNIGHLQETGVGRTVNALRKHNGEIGDAAKALVGKWKEMVVADGDESDAKETSKAETIKNNESKDKHKPLKEKSSSSHRDSDKKKSTSNSASEEDSKHSSRKSKEETRHRHRESSNSKKNKDKHKPSKREHYSSDESDEEESDYETRTNKDRSKSSSEERKVKPEKKHKHSKRDNSVLEDDNQEFVKSKRRKYSESENSDEEQPVTEKKHSHKSSKHHEKKEKSKHEHRKDKKEKSSESKSKKEEVKHKEKSSSSGGSSSKSTSKSDKRDKDKESKSDNKSKHSSKNSDHSKKSKKSSYDVGNHGMSENGIGSGSGASFAEALGMLTPGSSKSSSKKKVAIIHPLTVDKSPPRSRDSSPDTGPVKIPELLSPKKLTPLEIKMDNLLPEITPNYRPLGFAIDNGSMKNKLSSEDETLSAIMYNKISRTKVYSGNKVAWGKVPSLFEICTRVLQDNIDALEYTGGVPYLILKPVIERANPDQLFMLEHHNPYLIEDTDELWQLHCNKEFRNKRREEMETWRDMYMRCLDEREAKLRALTANIKQSQDKSLPVRQTKLAYVDSIVKPPRNIARKQAKHGTGGAVEKKPAVTPSSRLNALATSGAAGQVSVPNPGARAVSSSGSSTAVVKPKKAPLMQKTLALMKSRIFRR